MGLDEASMLLRVEVGDHVADVTGLHIEPRRDEIERSIERRALKDEQRTDHLHPGRAALRRAADDDVARPRREPLPTVAVPHRRSIPNRRVPSPRRKIAHSAQADARARTADLSQGPSQDDVAYLRSPCTPSQLGSEGSSPCTSPATAPHRRSRRSATTQGHRVIRPQSRPSHPAEQLRH